MRKHIAIFSAAGAASLAVLLAVAWMLLGFSGTGLSIHGWIALVLGVVLTCGLAIALMALVFASDSGGYDTRASGRPEGDA